MRESRTCGPVRGVLSNGHSYRDRDPTVIERSEVTIPLGADLFLAALWALAPLPSSEAAPH